jgi:putative transposase
MLLSTSETTVSSKFAPGTPHRLDNRRRRAQATATREHRKEPEHPLLRGLEQLVAPRDRVAHTGLPDAISAVWPAAITQTCIVHLLRNSFRYASRRDWAQLAKDLRPVYTAPTEAAALEALAAFAAAWEARYPAIIKLWEHAWAEFVPFLAFDLEIRTVIATTNAIESLNARFRRSVKARGHFPNEQAALKHLYLTIVSLDPTGRGRRRWTNRWKAALNAFDIAFDGRVSAGRK